MLYNEYNLIISRGVYSMSIVTLILTVITLIVIGATIITMRKNKR